MDKHGQEVAVIVPTHKSDFDDFELISLEQCFRVLGKHQIFLCAPESIDLKPPTEDASIVRFPNSFFTDIQAYNRLLLTPEFYGRFESFGYILIYQLDSFVFTDELLRWCAEDYDYIGAPWLGFSWPNSLSVRRRLPLSVLIRRLLFGEPDRSVGNGGFSLRKVSTFLSVLDRFERQARRWPHNEDQFWSIFVPNLVATFKIPPLEKALKFAFETEPRKCYEMNDRELPFGCHAWPRYDPDFWFPFLRRKGYDLPSRGQKT